MTGFDVSTLNTAPMPLPLPISAPRPRWDIFCTVIDNYGDIGVCWRLARQLAAEHDVAVRLWVDDLAAFSRLCPEIDSQLDRQHCTGVEVRYWLDPFPESADPADVVIEAFACQLPESYVVAMASRQAKPYWINLEYMSAEAWVADCHGLPSPHPQLPLIKHFFIPGFDENSAGLLRERDLLGRHAAFDADTWWRTHGGKPADKTLSISLFAYENHSLVELTATWRGGQTPVLVMATDSRVLASLADACGRRLGVDERIRQQSLEVRVQPFMRQEAYDELLAACDVNFVRGEDSLVRAIWAGKPFVWHIYPQDDGVHLAKLEAFLDRYCAGLDNETAQVVRDFWRAWNAETASAADWQAYAGHLPAIAVHTRCWRDQLAQLPDLAATLAEFCRNPI